MDPTKIQNIFLADDDAYDRMLFKDALFQIAIPSELTLLNDGFELMNQLDAVIEPPPPHVIFLDLNMPRKNGLDCLKEIRATPKLKNIPIVIFSTTANTSSVEQSYIQGANHYICKPRSFQLLIKAIETILVLEMWQKPQPPKNNFVLLFD
ncbi:MAG: response regulator [Bacteroidetes bacterium]|nr:response regulator [Bacteroidota bacterium]